MGKSGREKEDGQNPRKCLKLDRGSGFKGKMYWGKKMGRREREIKRQENHKLACVVRENGLDRATSHRIRNRSKKKKKKNYSTVEGSDLRK